MNRLRHLLLATCLLLITPHRLPAPIQEIPESPTPAPEDEAKPKKAQSKPRAAESEQKTKSAPKPSGAAMPSGPARFAGTWTGTINQGILGNIEVSLVIDARGTSVKDITKMGSFTHPATINGNTMTWRAGWLKEIEWTFTPSGDGKTAAVTSKSGLGVNGASTFHRK